MIPRPAALLCCSLILAGVLLDSPDGRARMLRALSSIAGRASVRLRRLSLTAGLRYIDMAYPSVDTGVSPETSSDRGTTR